LHRTRLAIDRSVKQLHMAVNCWSTISSNRTVHLSVRTTE